MKTRAQIYSHEASGILRDISTYSKHYEAKKLRPDKAAAHIPRWRSEASPTPATPVLRTAPAPKKDAPAKKQKIITTSKESILSKPKKEE